MKSFTKFLPLLALIIIIGGVFRYCSQHGGGAEKGAGGPAGGATPVVTYKVVPEILPINFNAIGTLEANQSAVIRPEVKGIITAINFQEGQKVAKGAVLLQVDKDIYTAELNRTKAAYDLTKITYNRRNELRQKGVTAAQSSDEAEADLRQAKAQYELAQINLAKATLVAPFNGIVGLREVSVGDYLHEGDDVTHIVEIDPMKVQFSVPEKFMANLQDDLNIAVGVDAYPGQQFSGTVYAIDPVIDLDTRNVLMKALVANPDMKLKPGMFASVQLEFGKKEGALMIPEEAIVNNGNDKSVFKVVGGKAAAQPVEIGVREKGRVEITKGLAAGDEVITAGTIKVKDGAAVTSMPEGPSGQPEDKPAPGAP
jgi:membrane fusion protein (multidrug efflux system)